MLARKIVPFGVGFTMALTVFISFAVLGQGNLTRQTITNQTAAIPLRIEVSMPDGNDGTIITQQSLLLDVDTGQVRPVDEVAERATVIQLASHTIQPEPSEVSPKIKIAQPQQPTKTQTSAQRSPQSLSKDTKPDVQQDDARQNNVQQDDVQQNNAQQDALQRDDVLIQPVTLSEPAGFEAQFEPVESSIRLSANLRAGPGLAHQILGLGDPGDTIHLFGRNEDASWYKIDNGWWIAGFLLVDPPLDVPVLGHVSERALEAVKPARIEAEVVEILSGNMIEVHIGNHHETVRYIGIDVPPQGQPGSIEAAQANSDFVADQIVHLVANGEYKDSQGHLLRHVYLLDGTYINGKMVAGGWAWTK